MLWKNVFLGVDVPPNRRAAQRSIFWDLRMPIPFHLERTNSVQTHMEEACSLCIMTPPVKSKGQGTSDPHFLDLTYSHMVWHGTTKSCMLTKFDDWELFTLPCLTLVRGHHLQHNTYAYTVLTQQRLCAIFCDNVHCCAFWTNVLVTPLHAPTYVRSTNM